MAPPSIPEILLCDSGHNSQTSLVNTSSSHGSLVQSNYGRGSATPSPDIATVTAPLATPQQARFTNDPRVVRSNKTTGNGDCLTGNLGSMMGGNLAGNMAGNLGLNMGGNMIGNMGGNMALNLAGKMAGIIPGHIPRGAGMKRRLSIGSPDLNNFKMASVAPGFNPMSSLPDNSQKFFTPSVAVASSSAAAPRTVGGLQFNNSVQGDNLLAYGLNQQNNRFQNDLLLQQQQQQQQQLVNQVRSFSSNPSLIYPPDKPVQGYMNTNNTNNNVNNNANSTPNSKMKPFNNVYQSR